MVEDVEELTALEVTGNVADVELATMTEPGTLAAEGLLLERATETPSAGAGLFRVTVAVELVTPPSTVAGLSESDETAIEPGVAVAGMLYE